MEVWEWQLAAAIVAAPLVIFGLVELLIHRRRRRERALAQRSKSRP